VELSLKFTQIPTGVADVAIEKATRLLEATAVESALNLLLVFWYRGPAYLPWSTWWNQIDIVELLQSAESLTSCFSDFWG